MTNEPFGDQPYDFEVAQAIHSIAYYQQTGDAQSLAYWELQHAHYLRLQGLIHVPAYLDTMDAYLLQLRGLVALKAQAIIDRQNAIETKAIPLDPELQKIRKECIQLHEQQIKIGIAGMKFRRRLEEDRKQLRALAPELLLADGTVDVFAVAQRAQRLADKQSEPKVSL